MLQAHFAIIRGPARFLHHEDLTFIMKACIILHNMIIEDERVSDNELVAIASSNYDYDSLGTDGPVEVSRGPRPETLRTIYGYQPCHSRFKHPHALRHDIIAHLWTLHGQGVIK